MLQDEQSDARRMRREAEKLVSDIEAPWICNLRLAIRPAAKTFWEVILIRFTFQLCGVAFLCECSEVFPIHGTSSIFVPSPIVLHI